MAERGTVPKSQGEGCASPSLPESCSLQSCLLGLQENARCDFFYLVPGIAQNSTHSAPALPRITSLFFPP